MKRRYYTGSDLRRAVTIEDLRQRTLRRLPAFAREYLEGGGEDELSLGWNRDVFKSMRFEPRMLVDTTAGHVRTSLFDREIAAPIIIAPTGHSNLFRRDGDLSLARAAAAAGIPYTLSTMSNTRLERLPGEAGGRLWMQLYILGEKALRDDIIGRAEEAGYEALVFTTDVNVHSLREWDLRQFREPAKPTLRGLIDVALHPRWCLDVMVPDGLPKLVNITDHFPRELRSTGSSLAHIRDVFGPNITWDHVAELRKRWPRKLLIKGVLSPEDARRAADAGCDGIVLSNHGARHFDSCLSPMEILPEVADALGDRLTIIIDGGFRRGSDIVKALAFGAHAVMVGRATLYGLCAGGEPGAARAIAILKSETERVLGQLGCVTLDDLGPHLIRTGPAMPSADPAKRSGRRTIR